MNQIITNTLTDSSQIEIVHPTIKNLSYPEFEDIDITIKSFAEINAKNTSFGVSWILYNIDINVSVFDIDRQRWYHIHEHLSSNDLLDWQYEMPSIDADCDNAIDFLSIDFINKTISF